VCALIGFSIHTILASGLHYFFLKNITICFDVKRRCRVIIFVTILLPTINSGNK
jgi:hypothetical protein